MASECEAFVLSDRGAGNPTSLSLAPQQGTKTLTPWPKTQLSNKISAKTHKVTLIPPTQRPKPSRHPNIW